MQSDDAGVNLPRPYGDKFEFKDGLEDLIENRLTRRENARRFFGRLSDRFLWRFVRTLIPISAILIAIAVMAIPEQINASLAALISGIIILIFITPSTAASNYALWVGMDRLGARGRMQGERDSSIERILNTLQESRLHEHMRIGYLLTYSILLWVADRFPEGDETRGLLLVISILLASIAVVHSILVERRTPKHSDDLPFLVHHAPSQHKSALNIPLTEIMRAHLDPESAQRFNRWEEYLHAEFKSNISPVSAIEHILHITHLRGQQIISHKQFVTELEALIDPKEVNSSVIETPHLDLPTLSRLVGHTRAWQSAFFRQIDRLQFGLMDHNESLAGHSWRMDASLPLRCGESRGDLFVVVNNLGEEEIPIQLEVHVPNGQPDRQTFRLTPQPLTPPRHPLPIWSNDEEDVVTWLSKLMGSAHVLWLGVAWEDETQGRRPVRISIRHIDGETILSETLWTEVMPRESGGDSLHQRMNIARRVARRWQKQATPTMENP